MTDADGGGMAGRTGMDTAQPVSSGNESLTAVTAIGVREDTGAERGRNAEVRMRRHGNSSRVTGANAPPWMYSRLKMMMIIA